MDYLRTRGFSHTLTVRISQAIASIGCPFIFIAVNHWNIDMWHIIYDGSFYAHFILSVLTGICVSISSSGYLTSLASIAPSYTGFIASIVLILDNIQNYLSHFIMLYFYNKVSLNNCNPHSWPLGFLEHMDTYNYDRSFHIYT